MVMWVGIIFAVIANGVAALSFWAAYLDPNRGDKDLLAVAFGGPLSLIIAVVAVVAFLIMGWKGWCWGAVALPVLVGIIGLTYYLR